MKQIHTDFFSNNNLKRSALHEQVIKIYFTYIYVNIQFIKLGI